MKKILTFATALCATMLTIFSNNVTAQSVTMTQDTAYGGQMKYYTKATVTVPADSSVSFRNIWGFNPTFNPLSQGVAWSTYHNTDTVTKTLHLFDSVPMTFIGTYVTKWEYQSTGDTTSHFTVPMPVTITPVKVDPEITTNTVTSTTNGAAVTFNYNTGYDNPAQVKVLLSLGDTTLANPSLQNTTISVVDSGIASWNPTGYPANYIASFKLIIKTTVGSDTTEKRWFKVLPSNAQWVSAVDSFGVTDTSITARAQVICNSTVTVRAHIAYFNQSSLYHIDQTITGTGIAMPVYATFSPLTASTDYHVWFEIVGGAVGVKTKITTAATVYTFKVTTDSVKTVSGKVRVYGTVTVPSGQTAQVGAMRALGTDINFNVALDASPLQTFTQGVGQFFYDFTISSSDIFGYKVYGYSSGGGYVDGVRIPYGLVVVGDTTKPTVTMFDTVSVTSTTADVVFTASDNVGVTQFLLQKNGTVVATLLSSQSSYSFTGLTANTTYTLGLQAKDDAGNLSLLQTIVITTDATGTTGTAATLTSIPAQVCFTGNGWTPLTVNGVNFAQGATFSVNYYDGQLNDVGTVTWLSSGQVQARIWDAHTYDSVDVTIINPNANVSNTLRTKVVFCTGINDTEATREEGAVLTAFPNPCTDVITINVGLQADYIVATLMGQEVQRGHLLKGENQLSLQQLPAGVYIMKTSTGLTKKIVKQ